MTPQERPSPTDEEIQHLAQLIAGEGNVDLNLLRKTWSDLPQDHEDLRPWLATQPPETISRVTALLPGAEPKALPQELTDCPPLPDNARLDPATANGAGHWIDVYADYADGISPMSPMAFHVSAALFLASTAIARRLVLRMSHGDIFPNLFMVWVAPTTLYCKSTSLRVAEGLAWRLIPHLLSPQDTTPEAFLSDLSGREPPHFDQLSDKDQEEWRRGRDFAGQRGWVLDEMSSLLAQAGRDYNAGLTEALLRFYDCVPRFTRSTRGQGRVVIRNSYLSLLGASTPAALSLHLLSERLWGNGWWPRFAIITPEAKRPEWRIPRKQDEPAELVAGLQKLYEQLPTATWPETPKPVAVTLGAGVFAAWQHYNEAMRYNLLTDDLDQRLWGTYGRLPDQALKVSIILAGLDWPTYLTTPQIELPHLARALTICESWRESAHRVLSTVAATEFDRVRVRILRIIGRCLPKGASLRDLAKAMRDKTPTEIAEAVQQMIDTGDIREVPPEPGQQGRPTTRYLPVTE